LYSVVILIAAHGGALCAQDSEKPRPGFTLSIEEDKEAAQSTLGLHRLLVKHTNISIMADWRQFHDEAQGMYNMIVLRDGVPAQETTAMRRLRAYRKVDDNPHIKPTTFFKTGESWTDTLDVSDYYDMSKPGNYEITVTRESLPLNPKYSVTVRSNTITVVVPQVSAASAAHPSEKPKPRFDLIVSKVNPDEWPPVIIRVEMQNKSDSVIREAKCWSFMGMYNFSVIRSGEILEANDQMRSLQKSRGAVDCPGNETLIEIPPGGMDAEELPISNFFDLQEPGAYGIYVSRETYPWNPVKSVLVESSPVTFVVSPPPAPPQTDDKSPADGGGPQ
jgi:hypothetical protein